MTQQRNSVTIGGVTWYYSANPAAYPSVTQNMTYKGASGVNTQFSGAGGDTFKGGGGGSDNTFYVSSSDTAIAGSQDGVDTIASYYGSVTLPKGFTDGSMYGPGVLTGNSANNILTTTGSGAQTIVGGSGDDLMIGSSSGQVRYVVNHTNGGSAVIEDFKHGSDVLQLDNFKQFDNASLATIDAAMTQSGSNVILNLGGGQSVTFVDQQVAQFTAQDFAVPDSTAGLKMTFDDEFNSLSASSSGAGTTWQFMTGHLNGSAEVENYEPASSPNSPFSIVNGVLNITASPVSTAPGQSYTSGGLTTAKSFSQTYGLFEVNAKMPSGAGMWPAFWLLPADGGAPTELDAPEEVASSPGYAYFSTHSADQPTQTVGVDVGNTSNGFHTYGVDWEPNTITYYFDGNAVASVATPADMNRPMYMLLNLAVGSAQSWPGAATGETASLQVNWIRAYASATAVQPPLTLVGYDQTINKGDGSFNITGTGFDSTITLGNGNQTINLTEAPGTYSASADAITVGNGNQTISVAGSYNTITAGSGTSTITAGGSDNTVTIGGTPTGTTSVLDAGGYGNSLASTAAGNVIVTAAAGGSTINLAAGNQVVNLAGGANNTVTVGSGNSTINGGIGQDVITTGAGDSNIAVIGYNNVISAGPGNNTISGGYGNDTFFLNPAGSGLDTISNFNSAGGDMLNLTNTLAGLPVQTMASFSDYVTSTMTQAGTVISVDTTGHGGSGQAIALLAGVNTSVGALAAANNFTAAGMVF